MRIMGAHHDPVQPYLIQLKMEQFLLDFAERAYFDYSLTTEIASLFLA